MIAFQLVGKYRFRDLEISLMFYISSGYNLKTQISLN